MEEGFVLTGNIGFLENGKITINDHTICETEFWEMVDKSGRSDEIRSIVDDVSYVGSMKHKDFERIFPKNNRDLQKSYRIIKRMDSTNVVEFYKRGGFEIFI